MLNHKYLILLSISDKKPNCRVQRLPGNLAGRDLRLSRYTYSQTPVLFQVIRLGVDFVLPCSQQQQEQQEPCQNLAKGSVLKDLILHLDLIH